MATNSVVRRNADEDGRSTGGKIVRSRRAPASSKTPYTRSEPRSPTSGNLKWLSALIHPALAIASGAGKILSTVLGPDTDSSSSSLDDDSDSEYEDDTSFTGDEEMKVPSLDMMGEKVHLIRQLVLQETFSREECYELINLIQSRIIKVDESISETEKNPDVCTTTVMEARKWLEDKKSGPSCKKKVGDQMCVTNQGIALSHVSESEMGSPVDMAKTYMHARPAWSSPSLKHVEFRTSSPMENSREELSRSIFHSPLQLSETKRTPLSTGSWNILEEIRKVRAKATEDLLATTSAMRIDFSSYSPEKKSRKEPLTNKKPEKVSYNLRCRTSNANSNPSIEMTTTYSSGLPDSVELEHDRLQNEALNSNNVLTQPQNDETIQAVQSAGTSDGYRKPNEMNVSKDSAATAHALSLSAADQNSERCVEIVGVIDPSKENGDMGIPSEISEPSATHTSDDDSTWTGSQNSSNTQDEDLWDDATQSNPKRKAQSGRLTRGYSRRGRGRGKRGNGTS